MSLLSLVPLFLLFSVDASHGKIDLSLRLSHVDPEAATKLRKKEGKNKARKEKEEKRLRREAKRDNAKGSDGEINELESVDSRYIHY